MTNGAEAAHTDWPVLEAAHRALRSAVREIPIADWAKPTPCDGWNIAQVLLHAAGDQQAYAAFLTGEPGPAYNPFEPATAFEGAPEDVLEPALSSAAKAWAGVQRNTAEVPVPIPPQKMSAELGAAACALDAAVHAWDIAVAAGQPSPLTADLARPLLAAARQLVEPLRGFAFGPELPAEEGDDVAALLRYLGRRPDWSPAQS
ncbi:TIGR03086 family metal-binding protein [Streptomyces coffeae]|uniref:TIGR03086 family protein n=1 Tax=Streptomyces coffeae TaxID=621382 RepID=A0ABS1NEY6_9ACTN|nr:TIGR03086 family metal-binding protein [Streptomyces coffeae]MBL1098603.1 TIGR03086 family protein [Streptomyces coffeae]